MANVIFLKGSGIIKEAVAAASGIKPGHRLDLSLNSGVLEVGVGAAGAAADGGRAAFAVEASEIGYDNTTAYPDNAQVKYLVAHKGDEVLARAAVGLSWSTGAPIYSAAAGQVTDVAGSAVTPIGYALSDVSTSVADDLVAIEVA